MFWGTGSNVRQKKISETQVVYNRYRYAHFMFVSRAAWGYHYILSTLKDDGWQHKDITKEEALQLTLGDALLPNLWARYSLYVALGGLLLLGFIATLQ